MLLNTRSGNVRMSAYDGLFIKIYLSRKSGLFKIGDRTVVGKFNGFQRFYEHIK